MDQQGIDRYRDYAKQSNKIINRFIYLSIQNEFDFKIHCSIDNEYL